MMGSFTYAKLIELLQLNFYFFEFVPEWSIVETDN